jgi:hypothetical protein
MTVLGKHRVQLVNPNSHPRLHLILKGSSSRSFETLSWEVFLGSFWNVFIVYRKIQSRKERYVLKNKIQQYTCPISFMCVEITTK